MSTYRKQKYSLGRKFLRNYRTVVTSSWLLSNALVMSYARSFPLFTLLQEQTHTPDPLPSNQDDVKRQYICMQ